MMYTSLSILSCLCSTHTRLVRCKPGTAVQYTSVNDVACMSTQHVGSQVGQAKALGEIDNECACSKSTLVEFGASRSSVHPVG